MKPVPVSIYPDEIIVRPMVTLVQIPGLFDAPPIPKGTIVYIRRSTFLDSARSYHVEDKEGNFIALMTEQRMRKELVYQPSQPLRSKPTKR